MYCWQALALLGWYINTVLMNKDRAANAEVDARLRALCEELTRVHCAQPVGRMCFELTSGVKVQHVGDADRGAAEMWRTPGTPAGQQYTERTIVVSAPRDAGVRHAAV